MIVEVRKGCDGHTAPGNHGQVGCACGNGIEEWNKLQPDTLLVAMNLVNSGRPNFTASQAVT